MRPTWAERGGAALVVVRVVAVTAALPHAARAATDATTAVSLRGDWSPVERAAVTSTLSRLEPAVRTRLPHSVSRDVLRCDAEGWPDDDVLVDARGDVHLCASPRETSPEKIARQVGEALLFGFDHAVAWSDDSQWRRLNRWQPNALHGFAPRPENESAAGFAGARGRRTPRWDLTTFLAASWLEAPTEGDDLSCRLMSQAAFVRARLAALAGHPVAAPVCAAFRRWADLEHLTDVEIVLAEPSTAMVGSLFGHIFLRLVYRDDDGESPPHLSRTVAFLADNDVPFQADRGYAWKGIVGAYRASLHERPFLEAYREYSVTEGRDLRRWRLDLPATERATLLERLWTVMGTGQYAYYFFRQNCATLMMELLDDLRAPDDAVGRAGLLAAPPASTLEAWAGARTAEGAPLLQFVAEPVLSFDHEARMFSRDRAARERKLVAGSPAELAPALAAAFADAHDPSPARRESAYARLATLLGDARAGPPADVRAWLRDGAAIESDLSVVANLEAETRADAARRVRVAAARDALSARLRAEAAARRDLELHAALTLVDADEADRRMQGYRGLRDLIVARPDDRQLVPDVRLVALLSSEARYDVARLVREPALRDALLFEDLDAELADQAYVRTYAELVRVPISTQISPPLRALQRARESLFTTRHLADAAPPLAPDGPAATATARSEYDASLHRSGIDQVAASAGALVSAPTFAPALVLSGALYDERLGDHRCFGFPSDTAFVVARSELWLGHATESLRPEVLAYEARVFGYRSLRRPFPESAAGRWPLGWELYLDLRGNRARALATEVEAGWGVLAPLVDRGELANHLLAGFGLAYAGYFPTASAPSADKPQALAAPLSLELRAALGAAPAHRSWLAARLAAAPSAIFAGAARRVALETRAAVEAHIALRPRTTEGPHDPALLLRAEVLRTTLSLTARVDALALVEVGIELR